MKLSWNDLVQGIERLERLERLEQVVIEIEKEGLTWRVFGDGGQELIALPAYPRLFPKILVMTETLLNAEFGIERHQLCEFPLN